MITAEHNRLETATSYFAELTTAHLEYLKQQQDLIKQLISDHFDLLHSLANQTTQVLRLILTDRSHNIPQIIPWRNRF
jgi:hypothetical protein